MTAFRSPNRGSIGTIAGTDVRFDRPAAKVPVAPFASCDGQALPSVEIVYGYAGIGTASLDFVRSSGARGIVLAGTGDGSIPHALLAGVRKLRAAGIVVVRSSRTNAGTVRRNGEVDDEAMGLVAAHTLNPQKSRILPMLALWAGLDVAEMQEAFESASQP